MKKLIAVITILGMVGFASIAQAGGTFQMGPQLGYSGYEMGGLDLSDVAVGIVARYTVPMEGSGLFLGLHTGFAKEFAKYEIKRTINIRNVQVESSSKVSAEWSIDVMPRIGYDFGDVSLSLASGLSFLQGQVSVSVLDVSVKDKQWHTGWKIAPGIDYDLSENFTLFGTFDYAKYNSKDYNLVGLTIPSGKPEMVGGRIGVLYNF